MSELPTLKAFDVPDAVSRMLGQPALWWQALALFVAHYEGWEAGWHACIGRDGDEARRVHALRSGATNVGARRLAGLAAQLEELLRERLDGGTPEISETLRQQLHEEFGIAWREAEEACRNRLSEAGL